MLTLFTKYKYQILLWILIVAYITYFSSFTILRYKTLYASYYDLGIMHQTVYNTYMSIKTGDWSRFLELTNPVGPEQIKRLAIHNDSLLVILSLFYFIHNGPETLLVIQSAALALGALAVFKIAKIVFKKNKYVSQLSLIFSLAYLFYPPLQRSNIFDFHAVVLATTFLLFMFYFWLVKKYWVSFIFFGLSILSKEQVALTTMMFGLYSFIYCHCERLKGAKQSQLNGLKGLLRRFAPRNDREWLFSFLIIIISIFWFVFSVFYLTPLSRGGDHFAISRYSDFGDSPVGIIIGILTKPYSIFKLVFRSESFKYFNNLLLPVGFLPFLSPLQLLIALPEFAINLLSKNPNMRNMIYHYTAVITPFVFISGIYGARNLITWSKNLWGSFDSSPFGDSLRMIEKNSIKIIVLLLLFFSITYSYSKGPLPFAKAKNIHPFKYPQRQAKDTMFWAKTLRDENLKISTTGQLSPFFTSRRYFYTFSPYYYLADYVLLRLNEIYDYPEKDQLIPVYQRLVRDKNYELIYQKDNFEVYKKVKP